ncbi:MAG TPA: hypothetical protein VFX50_04090, partial [Gemmatimonadales bacterium]|nr:hypothetical protein [Gemmatimonadales bacterium]
VVSDGETGRLVRALEPAALAAAIVEALARPDLRAAWAERARHTVEAFGIAHTAERTLAAYAEVLEARSTRA